MNSMSQAQNSADNKSPMKEKKKTFGIAFAGGGGRGYAHIGAIKAMEEYGIPRADVVSGTSVGSIIGSAYAMGYSADEIFEYAKKINIESFSYRGLLGINSISKLFDRNKFSRFFSVTRDSETIEKLMIEFYGNKRFTDTKSKFYTNAVDLYTGIEVVLDSGYMPKACRASSSVPGIFTPTELYGMLLVDGGVLNNMPADIIRDEVDVLVGLDLYKGIFSPAKGDGVFDVLSNTMEIMVQQSLFKNHSICDLVIEPRLDKLGAIKFGDDAKMRYYDEGYRVMSGAIHALRELLRPRMVPQKPEGGSDKKE